MTDNEMALFDLLKRRSGWVEDFKDALRKYESLSSGERYVMRVLQQGDYGLDPGSWVDDEYAEAVYAVLDERGEG